METSIALLFVDLSLTIQYNLALSLEIPYVYLFDEVDYFRNAEIRLKNGVRYYEYHGKYALLSSTAQKVFGNSNMYLNFCNKTLLYHQDSIGVYLSNNNSNSVISNTNSVTYNNSVSSSINSV